MAEEFSCSHCAGGYAGIKLHHGYWPPIFKKLNKCNNAYLIGYHEKAQMLLLLLRAY